MGIRFKISDPEAEKSECKMIPHVHIHIPTEMIWSLENVI